MSHLIKILVIMFFTTLPAYSAVNGSLEYSMPIDYSKISREELETKAGVYYQLALKTFQPLTPTLSPQGRGRSLVNDEMTAALNMYKILQSQNPSDTIYSVRLGHLYDIIGMDKYAKGCFYAAIGCDDSLPDAYFRLGEFYYRRQFYKRALKFYKEAYKKGFSNHYDTLYKMGDIYEKLGDTEAALKYLKLASKQSSNSELDAKISRVENANQLNREYYSDTRIRLIER